MCGVVGYIGQRNAVDVLLDGLKRLEYRGYDSAGIALVDGGRLEVRRRVGKIARLEALLADRPVRGTAGLGHTRWATHGRPSDANAHPHADCGERLVVVHNGILENHMALKERLEGLGHRFRSETDTEVMAHLVEHHLAGAADLASAVRAALAEVRGAYAFALLSAAEPDVLVAAKRGAGSVVVGLGDGEVFLASDIPALLPYTRSVVILEDDEVAVVRADRLALSTLDGRPVARAAVRVSWDAAMAEKSGYSHFMLKEIHEQPEAVARTFHGRVDPESGAVSLPEANLDVARTRRVVFVSCGTSYHAGLVGRFVVERLAGLPAEVEIASEFRYRDGLPGADTLVVAISQSGETADTLGAVRAARLRGARTLAITNVVGSALAREADGVIYTRTGPEIGVASTKTFTSTLTVCYLLGLALGLERGFLAPGDGQKRIAELLEVPEAMRQALAAEPAARALAGELRGYENFLYLGRGIHHAIALEGALKLKEISYAHAEGYPAGEMKHGPIALIDERLPVVVLAPRDSSYDRMLGNLEEVRARGGKVLAVCHRGDAAIAARAEWTLPVSAVAELLAPMVSVIPLQLLAYHVAVDKGCDVDQPRNLAKSVTVE